MTLRHHTRRLLKLAAVCSMGTTFIDGCILQSDIAKRFREGYAPGFVSGVSNALTDPDNAEAGVRQAVAAFFDGLGAVLQPRTPSSAGD